MDSSSSSETIRVLVIMPVDPGSYVDDRERARSAEVVISGRHKGVHQTQVRVKKWVSLSMMGDKSSQPLYPAHGTRHFVPGLTRNQIIEPERSWRN